MGLDIGHSRATLIDPDERSLFCSGIILSEYRGFNVPLTYFDPFIQDVHTAILVKELVIPKDIKYYNWCCKDYKYLSNYSVIFPINESYIEKKIQEFDKEYGSDELVRFEYTTQISRRTITYFKKITCKGFYTENVGYQRKGMGSKFNKFCHPEIFNWVGIENFYEAYESIEFDELREDTFQDYNERLVNFKENFIDKYKDGASYMTVSY